MKPSLDAALEAELDAIRKDPIESIGFGEKAYVPYQPNIGEALISSRESAVTERLLAEARAPGELAYRLAMLHLLGRRTDEGVDAALLSTLEDPELRATSAYLLGRPGFKGYPARARDARVEAALRAHLEDPSTFEDPFSRRSFRTQDFVIAAYVRLIGPERCQLTGSLADLIGYDLPSFTDEMRADLLAKIKAGP